MNEHFLTIITIKKFKGFKNFTANKFKQINLVGGKNNIGKTVFLEACHLNLSTKHLGTFLYKLHSIKFRRENINILTNKADHELIPFIEKASGLEIISNINNISYKIADPEGSRISIFEFANQKRELTSNQLAIPLIEKSNVEFIDSFGFANWEIESCYANVQTSNQEKYLDNILKTFDERIEGFKIISGKPKCSINGEWYELTEMGDGVGHLVSIVTALFKCKDGYLFIDEVENGVHYTFLDRLWEIIFQVSKELNCQVFATTHSRECIEAFNRINAKDEGIYLELYRNQKTNQIEIKERDHEQLTYSLETNGEFRGE